MPSAVATAPRTTPARAVAPPHSRARSRVRASKHPPPKAVRRTAAQSRWRSADTRGSIGLQLDSILSVMSAHLITNARIVIADELFVGTLEVRDGLSARAPTQIAGAEDWNGDYLIAGQIELHTDNLEKHLEPRPGVRWPALSALLTHDAQVSAAGITTVLDAMGIGDFDARCVRAQGLQEAVRGGISISEFPTSIEAARAAHRHGFGVVMGAPNPVRGGSHSGNVSTWSWRARACSTACRPTTCLTPCCTGLSCCAISPVGPCQRRSAPPPAIRRASPVCSTAARSRWASAPTSSGCGRPPQPATPPCRYRLPRGAKASASRSESQARR